MDELKKLARQIVAAENKPYTCRFDSGGLLYVEIKDNDITFHLESGPLTVPISELSQCEATIAYDHFFYAGDKERKTKYSLSENLLMGLISPSQYYVNRFSKLLVLFVIFIAICVLVVTQGNSYLNNIPVDNDRKVAISVAMNDLALKDFSAGKDVSYDSSANYCDPAGNPVTTGRTRFMEVLIVAWVYIDAPEPGKSTTYRTFSTVEHFNIIVNLDNKSIIRTEERTFFENFPAASAKPV
jgi:hypothetical protein